MNGILLFFGKLLFPNLPRELRRRRMKTICITLFTGLAGAGVAVWIMLKMNRH
jgi:hypothetical protein